jgi:hypothetical protein
MASFKRWALVAVVAASIALTGCIYKKEVEVRHERTNQHEVYQQHRDEHHEGPAHHEEEAGHQQDQHQDEGARH